MKAINLKEFGTADNLFLDEIEQPVADAGQVLIKVHACSVNRPDIVQREGNYPPPKGDSEILGLEVAGVVESVGENVSRYKAGDKVTLRIMRDYEPSEVELTFDSMK